MPTLLFIDDDITDFNPGNFELPEKSQASYAAAEPWDDESSLGSIQYGPIGYFIRELESVRFDVIPATSVREAQSILSSKASKIDVIVLDVLMDCEDSGVYSENNAAGGMRVGFLFAEEIHRIYPSIPIWILSQFVPGTNSPLNQATVNDLLGRGIVVGVACKLDVDGAKFAQLVRDSLELR